MAHFDLLLFQLQYLTTCRTSRTLSNWPISFYSPFQGRSREFRKNHDIAVAQLFDQRSLSKGYSVSTFRVSYLRLEIRDNSNPDREMMPIGH